MKLLKKFIGYYKPYKKIFFFDLFCAAVISMIDLIYPQILRQGANTIFVQEKSVILRVLPLLAAGLLIMYIIQALCKYYVNCQGHVMGAMMERDMRRELFEHYEKLSFSYYDNNNSGQMMSRLVSDLFDISEFAHHGPENLFISLIKIIGSFVFLTVINWRLAIPLFVIVIVMVIFSSIQSKKMHATFLDNRKKIGDINARLQDTLSGIRVVQSFANEEIEKKKFAVSNENFLVSKKENYRCMGSFSAWNIFFQGLMYLTVLVFGGYLISQDKMEPADLAMYALYIGIFVSPIQILVELTEMIQKGLSGFRRFSAIMETEPDIEDAEDARELTNVKGNVNYDHVTFRYNDDEPVLSDVSFSIPAGRSIALVGPSGGGKTTICSLLPRFYELTGGKITIDGKDISQATLHSLRSQMGIMLQDSFIFSGTIYDNIRYGRLDATEEEIREAAKIVCADEFISEMKDGYMTEVNERGSKLSGGQKQLISFARTLLSDPKILVLDEATSSIDARTEKLLQQGLQRLLVGRTSFIIAHRLSTIKNCDKIMYIDNKGIAECGTHDQLIAKKGEYYKLYTAQHMDE